MRSLLTLFLVTFWLALASAGQAFAYQGQSLLPVPHGQAEQAGSPAVEAVQAAAKRLYGDMRVMDANQAAAFVREAKPDELSNVLAAVPPRRRAAAFLDMLVLRRSLSAGQAREVQPLLERLFRQERFIAWALRHERQARDVLASLRQGRQTFAGALVYNARIVDYGRTLVQHVDLAEALRRIRDNALAPNDSKGWKVFGNYERLLPQRPRGWYREMRIPTRGLRGPGPQRLVYGRSGEVYWTPDHYQTFFPIEVEADE